MKKIISILFVFILILTLLPAHEAFAGDCKGGGDHTPGKPVKENVDLHCTRAGGYDSVVYCTTCKAELSRTYVTVKALGHDWHRMKNKVTITRVYLECKNCGHTQWIRNKDSMNMIPGLVRYGNGEYVDYRASAKGKDGIGTLKIMPVRHGKRDDTDDISLYMTPHDVYVLDWEKYTKIRLVRGDAVLTIDPGEVTPEMFGLESKKKIDYYIFTLTPDDDGWLVKAEALKNDKKIPAVELTGVTLKIGDHDKMKITANGVYTAE